MKRLFMLFLTLCLLAAPAALAEVIVTPGAGVETIKAGNEITIDDVCTFTVKSVQEYDVFMGVESGAAQQFLVVSFDMLNWQTEPFYVRTQTSAELTYAEDFSFAPTYLWSDPGGTYQFFHQNGSIYTVKIYDVDENGNIVDGDKIMYVCGKYLMEQGRLEDNTIVTTVMSNLGLYKACDKIGMKYEQTAVGDKYVYENMMKNGFVLGGEQSGHIIFSKHAKTGDGVLTSLMLMEVILEKKQSLGKLADEVKIYPQILKNVRVKDKKTARENPAVIEAVQKAADELGSDGRILVRESGTEPVIRVMVEAASDEICEKYVDGVIDVIKAEGLTE